MIFVMNITQIYIYKSLEMKRYKKRNGNTYTSNFKAKCIITEKMITSYLL